uniref:peptidylprolyl isomerase n=1 Tax=Anthurium amnicola TaxID=1678845 RepID=A0A1D1XE92_9ARAE
MTATRTQTAKGSTFRPWLLRTRVMSRSMVDGSPPVATPHSPLSYLSLSLSLLKAASSRAMSRVTFSAAAARAAKDTNLAGVDDDEDIDDEPGEEIDSAPPLKVGEEREINTSGLRKRLLKVGRGWETPVSGDEVTVHYVGRLLGGSQFDSSRDRGEPFTFKLGQGWTPGPHFENLK